MPSFRVESLLSARLFLVPQLLGEQLYFISNLSVRLSFSTLRLGGSVPSPLIPPHIALRHPRHREGLVASPARTHLVPKLLVRDHNDGESYQPVFVPLAGGDPEPVFGDRFAGMQVLCTACDPERNLALLHVDRRRDPVLVNYLANLETGELREIATSMYEPSPVAHNEDFTTVVIADQYTFGDVTYYLWRQGQDERTLLFGTPLEQRTKSQPLPPNGLGAAHLTPDGALLFVSALFDDHYGLTCFPLEQPEAVQPVMIQGLVHSGTGELTSLSHSSAAC